MNFLVSALIARMCTELLKLEWLPMHAFLSLTSLRAQHQEVLLRIHKKDMLAIDLEILGSLYGRRS